MTCGENNHNISGAVSLWGERFAMSGKLGPYNLWAGEWLLEEIKLIIVVRICTY